MDKQEKFAAAAAPAPAPSSLSGRCGRIYALVLTDKKLERCVNGFSEENFIGKFQFGDVYRGSCNGKEVIVKIWKEEKLPGENKGRLEDEILLHKYFNCYEFHPNVAKSRYICYGPKHLAIVYHMNPKAIDTLHNLIEKDSFTWPQRIKVAFGLASLLRYMHTLHPNSPTNLPYLIRNINAAHILVDQDHEPLLFDFSMISGGILTDKRDLLNQYLQGCCSYNDPICARPGRWSDKCDVFSYGVVLLSLISKRIYKDDGVCTDVPFVYEWAKNEQKQKNSVTCFGKFKSSLVHHSLELEPDFRFSDVIKITNLALLCVEYDPLKRPTMYQIIGYMQNMHIVQCNANTWECCKMLDGVNEVRLMLHSSKRCRAKEIWQPLKWHKSLLVNQFKHPMHGNKGRGQNLAMIKSSIGEHDVIKVFSYEELIEATNSFSKENLICKFQFGNLFRGEIKGKKVVVKIWENNDEGGVYRRDNEDRLRDEISLLLHRELFTHPNLVKMIGYCFGKKKIGTVYDLDPQDILQNLAPKDEFTWLQRIKVIYEFAKLLEFLHAPNPPHGPYRVGNIEAVHVILDKDYRPKLFNFGKTVGGISPRLRFQRNKYVPRSRGYRGISRGIYLEEGDIASYGWILLCLISKTSPTPDGDDQIYYKLGWTDSEEPAEIDQPGYSLVHEDLTQERGFDENDGVLLTELVFDCLCERYPSMEEVVKRLRNLRIIRGHSEEMGIQNLPSRCNTNFKLVQKVLMG